MPLEISTLALPPHLSEEECRDLLHIVGFLKSRPELTAIERDYFLSQHPGKSLKKSAYTDYREWLFSQLPGRRIEFLNAFQAYCQEEERAKTFLKVYQDVLTLKRQLGASVRCNRLVWIA